MQFFRNLNIDFMGRRNLFLALSAVVVLSSVGVLATRGIKQGVEFTGGAQLILRFAEPPQLEEVRRKLTDAGVEGLSVTTSTVDVEDTGEPGAGGGEDLIIRFALPEGGEGGADAADVTANVGAILRPPEIQAYLDEGRVDINTADQTTLARVLFSEGGLDREVARADADALVEWRRVHSGLFGSVGDLADVPGLSDEGRAFLTEKGFAGPFALRGQEVIAASVSSEMRSKAQWAILGALGGMLIYIWIRFQFQWGLAAIVALLHDTLITLGAFSLAGMEANLPVVAAFLTLVGYSVNDSIVVFDRVRENLRTRGESRLEEVINLSINQTLSRTLITSGTTWVVVISLYLLGGMVIRPFAFVLLIGIIVGTYSSIYIASPVLLIWQKLRGRATVPAKQGGKRTRRTARAAR